MINFLEEIKHTHRNHQSREHILQSESFNVFEQLNKPQSLRGFITISVTIFESAVGNLLNRVFRKTDFVVKSVVDSLFEQSGPLFELPIRLKVLLGLGVISPQIFTDISAFIEFKNILNNNEQEYPFHDEIFLDFLRQLHLDQSLLQITPITEPVESLIYKMKIQRQEKILRSILTLHIADIYEQLQIESPL